MFSGALEQRKGLPGKIALGLFLGVALMGSGLYILPYVLGMIADILKSDTVYSLIRSIFAEGIGLLIMSALLFVGFVGFTGAISNLGHARRLARAPQLEPLIDVAQLDDTGIFQSSGAHILWSDILDIRPIHGQAQNGHGFHELLLQPGNALSRVVVWGGQTERTFENINLGERLYARWRSEKTDN